MKLNAFSRATTKFAAGLGVMVVYFFVMMWLSEAASAAFDNHMAGLIVTLIPPIGFVWWILYRAEKFREEIKDL